MPSLLARNLSPLLGYFNCNSRDKSRALSFAPAPSTLIFCRKVQRQRKIHTDGEKERNNIEFNIEKNTDRVTERELQRERER